MLDGAVGSLDVRLTFKPVCYKNCQVLAVSVAARCATGAVLHNCQSADTLLTFMPAGLVLQCSGQKKALIATEFPFWTAVPRVNRITLFV